MGARALGAVLAAAVACVSACGGGDEEGEPSGPARKTVDIVATDFRFDPATVEIDEAGVYAFRLVNDGATEHALEIEGEGTEVVSERVGPGASAELRVELAEGTYELYCPVGNHAELGMKGTIAVGGATPPGDTGEKGQEGGYGY